MPGMMRALIALAGALFFVLPFSAALLGYDPWLVFLCGWVLMAAGAFAGAALSLFKGPLDQ